MIRKSSEKNNSAENILRDRKYSIVTKTHLIRDIAQHTTHYDRV